MIDSKKLSLVALVFAGACGSPPPPLTTGPQSTTPMGPDPCLAEGFRQPTVDSTVCPGAPMCSCSGTDICCLDAVDAHKGVCEPIGRCRTFALQCDGPEDCAGAGAVDGGVPHVCCLDESIGVSGGGSECRPVNVCTGTGTSKVLCRSDDDCSAVVPTLPRCRPTDYGTPGVQDRGLDGLIGYCAK